MMSSSLLTVVPFTVENVRPVLEKTRNHHNLCHYLLIPVNKRDDAATAADYFVNHATQRRSWKWIIWDFDRIGDTDVAESIMENAEPSPVCGLCTLYNVACDHFLHMSIVNNEMLCWQCSLW